MGIRIRSGMVGFWALLCAVVAPQAAAAANGDNLVEYQRTDGMTENYYAAGDDNLVFGLAVADQVFRDKIQKPRVAADGLDEFVPIELKRWNNNAAKALMQRMVTDYFSAQNSTTNLVPTRKGQTDEASGEDTTNTMNLRHPYYAGALLEWTDVPESRTHAQALANATIQYFAPTSGTGFLNLVDVTTGTAVDSNGQNTQIFAIDWGMALRGMGLLANQLGNPSYWSWAAPRLQFAWDQRKREAGNEVATFAPVYDSEGWTVRANATPEQITEEEDMSDTDTLYLLRFAYEGARLASDHAIMSYLENVGNQWFTDGWMNFVVEGEIYSHNPRKLSRETGLPVTNEVYGDGKWNYVYALSALYRMTGNPEIIARIEELWETYLYVALDGLLVAGLRNGNDSFEVGGHPVSVNQELMLDALLDAYLATGSTTLLANAQGLALAIRSRPAEEQEGFESFTARPFLRLAEATNGGIGRLEVNFGLPGGLVRVETLAEVPVVPSTTLTNQSAVFYLPQGTYRVELGREGFSPRAVTLVVPPAGVKVDYLAGSPATSFLTGVVVQDSNDNAVRDLGEPPTSGAKVYVDSNNDGIHNPGETNQIVGPSGSYTFSVPIGSQSTSRTLRATLPAGLTGRWTTPSTAVGSGTPGHTVTFHNTGLTVTPAAFSWTTKKRISGNVFHDVNGNAIKNSSERNLTESIVYVDTNNNGVKNFGEPFAATSTSGSYSIGNLTTGGVLRVVRRSAVDFVSTP